MISFKQKSKGFTLVEMLISVGIFTVMSAIILANYPEFRSRSALDNLTAQTALFFREAQVYGISVREETGSFDTGYGVYVSLENNKQLVIFADYDKDRLFTPTGVDKIVETFTLNGGEFISKLCAPTCARENQDRPFRPNFLTAVFVRPNPDAYFSVEGAVSDTPSISLEISNRSGSYKKSVEVYTTGQISVQ